MKQIPIIYERDDSELLKELAWRLQNDRKTDGWFSRDMKLRAKVQELLNAQS